MKVFMRWIKCGEEQKGAFENSPVMGMHLRHLKGRRWKIIRKIRLVRLIRRMIEEGIIVRGVREMYEEGCRILLQMERSGEEVEEGGEEERYMYELYLLRVRGERKKMKESEVSLLRREVEEEKKKVEEGRKKRVEAEKRLGEANERVEKEKRKREKAERGREEEKKRADEEKRKREEMEAEKRKMEEEKKAKKKEDDQWIKNGGTGIALVKSLDGIGVEFGDVLKMRKENNSIIHNNEKILVSGFVGGKLDHSIHRMFE